MSISELFLYFPNNRFKVLALRKFYGQVCLIINCETTKKSYTHRRSLIQQLKCSSTSTYNFYQIIFCSVKQKKKVNYRLNNQINVCFFANPVN